MESELRELVNNPFYRIIDEYNRCEVDYCLIEDDRSYHGYESHKAALEFAMLKLSELYSWITMDITKAEGVLTEPSKLLFVPAITNVDYCGKTNYRCEWKADNSGDPIPYWYAFLEPPHKTGPVRKNGKIIREKYGKEDFEIVNKALFPEGTEELDIYEWSTDWSNYFDAGHEWWGTVCCTVYDKRMNRFVVITASSTD